MSSKPESRLWKFAKRLLLAFALLVFVLLVTAGGIHWYLNPANERSDGVVYGERHGHPLTLDVITPEEPNGLGIVLLVSGGWKSNPDNFGTWMAAPLLRKGFTVFAVSHLSQPDATVSEIVADMNRAVRFVRHHADDYGIDPDRIGVTGASAGGHLSLMLVTRGGPGDPMAEDPIDRESSAVQAAAIFFPVTNLVDLGTSTENAGDGGPPKSFRNSFGPEAHDLEKWKVIAHDLSPVFHVRKKQAPVLIAHGDADTLTPLEQSEWFVEAAREAGAEVELLVRPGKSHGWLTMPLDIRRFAHWFENHLPRKNPIPTDS